MMLTSEEAYDLACNAKYNNVLKQIETRANNGGFDTKFFKSEIDDCIMQKLIDAGYDVIAASDKRMLLVSWNSPHSIHDN